MHLQRANLRCGPNYILNLKTGAWNVLFPEHPFQNTIVIVLESLESIKQPNNGK